ncbi:MAG: triose-phosphate isomerase [bacterium]|nr:triose-phosphate isomerase [bacterium]
MKSLIIANWKANPSTLGGARDLFDLVAKGIKNEKKTEIVICPPFLYLLGLKSKISNLKLGAQDCFWADGAFTGEISSEMLKNSGIKYVIVGHSERRGNLGETEEMIGKKIKAVLRSGLKPILCISNLTQIKNSPKGVKEKIIIAFEPVSAIGVGKPYNVERAKKMREAIDYPFVLYGGSVGSRNAQDYIKKAGFQGLLVGTASLIPSEFIKIVKRIGNLD